MADNVSTDDAEARLEVGRALGIGAIDGSALADAVVRREALLEKKGVREGKRVMTALRDAANVSEGLTGVAVASSIVGVGCTGERLLLTVASLAVCCSDTVEEREREEVAESAAIADTEGTLEIEVRATDREGSMGEAVVPSDGAGAAEVEASLL